MADPLETRIAALERQVALWNGRAQAIFDEMVTLVPPGTIVPYTGTVAPAGWLLCNGESVPVEKFPTLAALLGTRFGTTASGLFVLPNLSGRVPVGSGQAASASPKRELGQTYGVDAAALTPRQLPAHSHSLAPAVYSFSGNAGSFLANQNNAIVAGFPYVPNHGPDPEAVVASGRATKVATQASGSSEPVDLSQPSLVVNYIIKF